MQLKKYRLKKINIHPIIIRYEKVYHKTGDIDYYLRICR
jgi:hypothetical protein